MVRPSSYMSGCVMEYVPLRIYLCNEGCHACDRVVASDATALCVSAHIAKACP